MRPGPRAAHGAEVRTIAFIPGYTETNSFIRAFSSWVGRTPGQYREEMGRRD